jgi:N-acetylglucosamine kinase-like BadF-type ATPase
MTAAFTDARLERHPVSVACLGLAGFDRPEDKQLLGEWGEAGKWAERLVLVNDGDLVIAAGTAEGWGVGVIAGTGSIAVARAPNGRKSRAGGWGHLIGDEGSAYSLVLSALRRLARRADRRDSPRMVPDSLSVHLYRALGISGPERLVSVLYSPEFDRARIAALAPAILAAAAEDASIAEELLRPAGAELAEMVMAAAKTLGFESGALPVAMAGGLLLSAPDVALSMLECLQGQGYDPVANRVTEPARGALVLARHTEPVKSSKQN